jgi:protein-tyrosine phosphatase
MRSTLYVIDGPWPGQLAIIPRPRGGDWLEDEIAAWKKAGLQIVVSALTPEETASMDLDDELAQARKQGLELLPFPIPDRGTPSSWSTSKGVFAQLLTRLNDGKHVGVHCRQGVGRSALIGAALLILAGIDLVEAWNRVEKARGCPVPDTPEQKAWVDRFTQFAVEV